MSTGNPDNPNATKKARKTVGATQAKATGKLIGVEAITVMKRDTMRISPDTGVTRIDKCQSWRDNDNPRERKSHSSHEKHQDKICDLPRKSPEKKEARRNWGEDFEQLRLAKNRKIAENKKEAQIIQKRLLAIAGDYQLGVTKDPQPGLSGS